ncbi:MAG: oligosaccharide flippase family protein [Gammaproteobacteria bacterium]|nr:oligosaccharide flippase family protein [Gammaproteobacteria bacterium]
MLLSLVLVARIIGRAGYGEFGLIRTTIMMFVSFGGLGLGLTANRFVAQYRHRDKPHSGEIITTSYALAAVSGLLTGVAVFAGARYLAIRVGGSPALESGLRLASAVLVLSAVNGAQTGMLQGLHAYRELAIASLMQGAIGVLLMIAGARWFGLNGALGGLLLQTCSATAVSHYFIRREAVRQGIPLTWNGFARMAPVFWRFSVPVMLMGLAVAPFKWVSETLLARSFGFQTLGVFHASMTVANVLIAAASSLHAPLVSLSASAYGSASSARSQYLNLYGSWYLFLVLAVPLAAFPRLASLPFGGDFVSPDFYAVTLLLILYCGMMLYYQGIMRMMALHGSMWFGFATNLLEGASLVASFLLLKNWGALGLGVAYVVSYVVRIAASLPYLLSRGIIPRELMLDRYFAGTLAVLATLVVVRLAGVL